MNYSTQFKGIRFKLLFLTIQVFSLMLLVSCKNKQTIVKPNILWLTCEDISPLLASYGDSTAQTPVLDKFASESMVFTNVFSTVGVCAPARSSLITGMYPTSIGTMHMRTGKDISSWGNRTYNDKSEALDINGDSIPLYSAVIPDYVKCFTEYLRSEGYYCTNNEKTDYQFAAPVTAWDENSNQAHWKNTPDGMPFFSVFNHNVTHESRLWINKKLPLTVNPDSVPLPDYFPENPVVRQDIARVYSNIELLDKQIGEKLNDLEEQGLLDNTIIFFFSDHGGPLPRGKREHYDSGLEVPFMVRFPNGKNAGIYSELISFVDLAPTILSLAGIEPPDYMQGQAFLGDYKALSDRKYIYGSGDRFDEFSDQNRCVRDEQFMYIKNLHPNLPRYKDVGYRKNVDMMNTLLHMHSNNDLNEKQSIWFEQTKPEEELYDCLNDRYQLNNLATIPEYAEKLLELRNELLAWQNKYGDKGDIAEKELLEEMWPGGIQPTTESPVLIKAGKEMSIKCTTPGASIAYIVSDTAFTPNLNSSWKLYTVPFSAEVGQVVYSIANRIGYADSDIVQEIISN